MVWVCWVSWVESWWQVRKSCGWVSYSKFKHGSVRCSSRHVFQHMVWNITFCTSMCDNQKSNVAVWYCSSSWEEAGDKKDLCQCLSILLIKLAIGTQVQQQQQQNPTHPPENNNSKTTKTTWTQNCDKIYTICLNICIMTSNYFHMLSDYCLINKTHKMF